MTEIPKKFIITEDKLTVIVFSLFFSWLLAFPFEGKILYELLDKYNLSTHTFVFGTMISHFLGLILCCFFIKILKPQSYLCSFLLPFL